MNRSPEEYVAAPRPPKGGSGASLPQVPEERSYSYPAHVQIDYLGFLEQAKEQARYEALRPLLDAADAVRTEVSEGGSAWRMEPRRAEDVKKEIVELIKKAMA